VSGPPDFPHDAEDDWNDSSSDDWDEESLKECERAFMESGSVVYVWEAIRECYSYSMSRLISMKAADRETTRRQIIEETCKTTFPYWVHAYLQSAAANMHQMTHGRGPYKRGLTSSEQAQEMLSILGFVAPNRNAFKTYYARSDAEDTLSTFETYTEVHEMTPAQARAMLMDERGTDEERTILALMAKGREQRGEPKRKRGRPKKEPNAPENE
jgi:hypothetical protein